MKQQLTAEEERLKDRKSISDAVTSTAIAENASNGKESNINRNINADLSNTSKQIHNIPKYTTHVVSSFPAEENESVVVTSNEPSISTTTRAIEQRAPININFDDVSDTFSSPGTILEQTWSSAFTNSVDLNILLPGFFLFSRDQPGLQTLVLQLSVPTNSNGWALNICPATASPDDDMFLSDVLFHFNPRYEGKKRGLVMNDRQGTWGPELRRPLGESR